MYIVPNFIGNSLVGGICISNLWCVHLLQIIAHILLLYYKFSLHQCTITTFSTPTNLLKSVQNCRCSLAHCAVPTNADCILLYFTNSKPKRTPVLSIYE